MLILWDIDGTILRSEGAGVRSMTEAGRRLFGRHFTLEGIEISGRLDPLIFADAARLAALEHAEDHHEPFRRAYGEVLARTLRDENTLRVMPGVRELIAALAEHERVTQGLLTGNYPETGRLKLRSAGLNPELFTVGAFGIHGASRRELPAEALRQYRDLHGRDLQPASAVVIGDTPHDVDCAACSGCRSLAVATGAFTVDQLRDAGADLAVETLADTDALLRWILAPDRR